MAYGSRRPRYYRLDTFEALGVLRVHPSENRDTLVRVADAQASFGGQAEARLIPQKVRRRWRLAVVYRYTTWRVQIGYLDVATAAPFIRTLRWWLLRGRGVTCNAAIDTDPKSPTYLDVLLNATSDPARTPVNLPTQRRQDTAKH